MGRIATKQIVSLPESEVTTLTQLLAKGTHKARTLKRARILLGFHAGHSMVSLSVDCTCSKTTVANIRNRYLTGGLTHALYDSPRSGRPPTITGEQRAKLTVLACTNPPQGRAKWTLRLLADKAVELCIVEEVSHTAIRKILKKTKFVRTYTVIGVSQTGMGIS